MLIDEKVNSNQKTQESNSKIQKTESSKLVDSSRMSQDSKPKVHNTGSSKSLRPKPIQKLQLKCELCHYTNHLTDDCYRILYCMICKREDHRTLDHEMNTASLKRSENYKAQPYQYASYSKQILKANAKPFPPCTHCGFNDHRPGDCRNYPNAIHVEALYTPPLTTMSLITSKERHIREPIWYLDSGCLRSMTGVKSYLHKYVEQPGPKVVFGDNSSCITKGYGSINCGGIVFTKVAFVNGLKYNLINISQLCDAKYIVQFDDKQGTIFNANKEIVLIAPRRNDVYVLDMSSLTPNGACFFAKASESVNWLWHKRLSHLNFKNINKLAKQNKVLGLPSLVYSKDKPCTTCEKGKHHRASFKTKQNFSIRKCLHLLHMDLFGPVSPMSINHEKYTLVIVDEYSRYTWVHFLMKKSQAPLSFFQDGRQNQNNVKVKQIRTNNGTEFRNHELESFYDEKGISQNFSSPYTPEKNDVVERKNRTLIEAARTMLNGLDILLSQKLSESLTQETNKLKVIICDILMRSMEMPLDEFIHEDDPSRQYQTDYDISYYVIPHGRALFELTQENHVLEVIASNEPDIHLTKDTEFPPGLINTKRTHEQNVQKEQIITQPTEGPSGNNTKISISINEYLVPDVPQSHISN
ncbi:retrovirus-related pol polyprotein from transposon TNT 1-94 [Tanacetum coccineum]